MSSNAKRVPEINLEDFERRLRAAGSAQGAIEDPLEELTRLVNTIAAERPQAPERVVDLSATRATRPAAPLVRPQPVEQPAFAPAPLPQVPQPPASFAASEAAAPIPEAPLLRPSLEQTQPEFEAEAPEYEVRGETPIAPPVRAKSGWYLKVGGLTAVGLVMVAGAAYLKLHGGSLPGLKSPPMIMAADGPSKVAPPDEKTVQSPSDSGALLTKDSTGSGQVKITSNQEQPMDMGLKAGDSPIAPTKDSPIIAPSAGQAFVAPVPPTPSASSSSAAAEPSAEPNPPAPPPVTTHRGPKTVTVRPDGSLVTADAQPATAAPASVAPSPAPAPRVTPSVTSQAASPTLDLPAKPAPAKTTARVNVAKTDTTAPTESVSAPLQSGSTAATDKSQKLPTKLRPPETQTADAQPAAAPAAPAAGGGDWAVQLAAPRSESDAQSAIQKLQTKYASTLGDNELGVRKAEVNGDTIYRVRASGLSKAGAQALCQKLKADGGDCFVAKN